MNRFVGNAEDITPMGLVTSEDRTTPENKRRAELHKRIIAGEDPSTVVMPKSREKSAYPIVRVSRTTSWKSKEIQVGRAIEDIGFRVHDANIVFGENCQNIDLIVYSKYNAQYIQIKSSESPASKDSVVIDGSPWTNDQLYKDAPIFNKHDHFEAKLVVIVDKLKSGETNFYIAPPSDLEALLRSRALEFAKHPKKDGTPRSIKFRKELPRDVLAPWHNAWHLLGKPSQTPA